MVVRVVQGVLVLILSMAALAAHATLYEITSTSDGPVVADGECTIREAVGAVTQQQQVGDCIAGTGTDRILLEAGQVYELDQGQLQLGGVSGINVTLQISVPNPEEDEAAVLDMMGNSRAFQVAAGSTLMMDGVSARNGNAAAQDGGLIHSSGRFEIRNGASLVNGSAANGGLVYATGPVAVLSGAELDGGEATSDGGAVYLHGQASMVAADSRLMNNRATVNGGAVALAPDFDGALVLQNSLLDGNEATNGEGGALFFRGDRVRFEILNSSLLANEAPNGAGALYIGTVVNDQDIQINNTTIADNFSGGSSGSVHVTSADEFDQILNTIIVGDRGTGDCSGALANGSGSNILVEYSRLGFEDPGVPTNCFSTGPGVVAGQTMTALIGQNAAGTQGRCTGATTAAGICDPLPLEPLPGYLPALEGANSPWNSGNPENLGLRPCLNQDQRGISRLENQCDIGAFEFEVAVGTDDEFTVLQGRTVTLDMGENDLGDGRIDCRRAAVAANPLTVFLPGYQSNEVVDNDLDNDGVAGSDFDIDQCAQVLIPPSRPGADVRFVEDPDKAGSILLEYTPGTVYHGLDEVAYRINRAAFEPSSDPNVFATRGNRNVEGITFIISEPDAGLREAETIEELGAGGGAGLMLLVMLGLVRRSGRSILTVLLALSAFSATAAEIQVTTLNDNFNPGDGFCTLREALYSSIDELVNLEGACANGQAGRDTVVLPRGCIQLAAGLGPLIVETSVTLRGQGAHRLDAGSLPLLSDYYNSASPASTTCRQDDTWTDGSILVGDQEQVIDARASLIMESLSIFNGDSAGNGGAIRAASSLTATDVEFYDNTAANLGGAVYLAGLPDSRQGVRFERVYFLNNNAATSGGALSLAGGQAYNLTVVDSTFEGNRAEQSGGAILMNAGSGDINIVNTLLVGNSAGTGSGGLDMSQAQSGADVINTTIVNNTGGNNSGLDLGTNGGSRVFNLTNSVYALNYIWNTIPGQPGDPRTLDGACSSDLSDPQLLNRSSNNLYSFAVNLSTECPVGSASARQNDEQPSGSDDPEVKNEFVTDGSGNLFTARNFPASEPVFVPPNLALLETGTLIVDKGFDGELSSGFGEVEKCRARDQRGLPRTSGQSCDRGSYEVQVTSAEDDEVNNKTSTRKDLLIDILRNDSTDPVEGQELLPETVAVTDVSPPTYGGWRMVLATDPEADCVPAADGYDEGCFLRFYPGDDPTPTMPESGDETPLGFCIDNQTPLEETLTYTVQASNPGGSGPETSNAATIAIKLNNLPPRIKNETVFNEPGGTVVIKLDVTDSFNGSVTNQEFIDSLTVTEQPMFAATDEFGIAVGTGIKLNTPAPGYITYVAGDTTKRFTDRFQLAVEDSCGLKSVGGEITIRYADEEVSGGELLAGGASMLPFAVLLLGGGLRRRIIR